MFSQSRKPCPQHRIRWHNQHFLDFCSLHMMELPTPSRALIHPDRNALRTSFSDPLKLKRDINQGCYQIQQTKMFLWDWWLQLCPQLGSGDPDRWQRQVRYEFLIPMGWPPWHLSYFLFYVTNNNNNWRRLLINSRSVAALTIMSAAHCVYNVPSPKCQAPGLNHLI